MTYVVEAYAGLSNRLKSSLSLETSPVVIFLSPKIPKGIRQLEGKMKWCEMVDKARLERMWCRQKDNSNLQKFNCSDSCASTAFAIASAIGFALPETSYSTDMYP
jgi:uncharacterized protein (DUF169 family)